VDELVAAVVVAAGRGNRMGTYLNKVFLPLAGKPVLAHTLQVLEQSPLIGEVVVVAAAGEEPACTNLIRQHRLAKVRTVATGGAQRSDSVARGLSALQTASGLVAVHDGARPLFTPDLLARVVLAATVDGAALAAVPVKDTIKIARGDGLVESTADRATLWAAQTPQVFRLPLLRAAYRQPAEMVAAVTDDASLVEAMGVPVRLVMGSYENIKITTPEDLVLAEAIIRQRQLAQGLVETAGKGEGKEFAYRHGI